MQLTGAQTCPALVCGEAAGAGQHRSPWAGNGGRYDKRWERWTHVLICECGYSTPVTTLPTARNALRRHHCDRYRSPQAFIEVPAYLPALIDRAVAAYTAGWTRWRPRLHVDGSAVLRAADGEVLRLHPAERFAVWVYMRRRGDSAKKCAQHLRLSWSTQARYRRLLEAVA